MPNVRPHLRAMRALSAIALRRILQPVTLMVIIGLVSLYCLMIFLALSFSGWWWLLLGLLIPLTVIVGILAWVMFFLLRVLMPRKLGGYQRRRLSDFTDKLLRVVERSRLPYPLIVVLIAKDVIRGRESSFLRDMIGDSKDLTKEFGEICRLFEK